MAQVKIFFSPYELRAKRALNSQVATRTRVGALLKFIDEDSFEGFADLQPWVEWGEEGLQAQLKSISDFAHRQDESVLLPLARRSIYFAKRDAAARKRQKNLVANLPMLKNNFLCVSNSLQEIENAVDSGYDTVKVKVGLDIQNEISFLNAIQNPVKIRLDANSIFHPQNIENFFGSLLPSTIAKIEYCEDPMRFTHNSWQRLSQNIPLALDQESAPESALEFIATEIVKPTHRNSRYEGKVRATYTSSMDHPLGVLHGAALALEKYPDQVHGFQTLHFFEKTFYHEVLQQQGPHFIFHNRFGIGFDELLKKENWKSL